MILRSLAFAALFLATFSRPPRRRRAPSPASITAGPMSVRSSSSRVKRSRAISPSSPATRPSPAWSTATSSSSAAISTNGPGAVITGQVNTVGGDVVSAVVPWSSPPDRSAAVRRLPHALAHRVGSRRRALLPHLSDAHAYRARPARTPSRALRRGRTFRLGRGTAARAAIALHDRADSVHRARRRSRSSAAVFLGKRRWASGRPSAVRTDQAVDTPAPLVALIAGLVLVTAGRTRSR